MAKGAIWGIAMPVLTILLVPLFRGTILREKSEEPRIPPVPCERDSDCKWCGNGRVSICMIVDTASRRSQCSCAWREDMERIEAQMLPLRRKWAAEHGLRCDFDHPDDAGRCRCERVDGGIN